MTIHTPMHTRHTKYNKNKKTWLVDNVTAWDKKTWKKLENISMHQGYYKQIQNGTLFLLKSMVPSETIKTLQSFTNMSIEKFCEV